MDSEDPDDRSYVRNQITWVVVCVGLGAYLIVWRFGDALPTWARYAIFGVVAAVAIGADAWELGARRLVDPDRWWRVLALLLVAVVGVALLWSGP